MGKQLLDSSEVQELNAELVWDAYRSDRNFIDSDLTRRQDLQGQQN